MDRVHTSSSTPRLPLRRLCGLLVVTLLFVAPAVVFGQSPSDRVFEFLESASGFYLLGDITEGGLSSGQGTTLRASFLEGANYMVVGYCNDSCTNLDLTLFDSSGEEVQSDRLPDSEPILMFIAESSGLFYIQVDAVECSVDRCRFAVGILGSTDEPGVIPGEDMAGRLTLIGSELRSMGFTEVGDERRGSLNTDQTINLPLTLQESLEYRVVAVCDIDCWDLDLALLDSTGTEVASDFMDDDLPILSFVADATGEYQVEVIMVACGVEPCAYRFSTFAWSQGDGPGGKTFSGELVSQQTVHGELEPKDERHAGAYLDVYEVEVRPGQRIIVDLRSDEFDTLLRLLDPDGEAEENDDFGYEIGHSHLEMMALKEGTYSIQVTSFSQDSRGAYVLQIAVVE